MGHSMSIGSKIRELRKLRNISQDELANMIGSYVTSISNYERDLQVPSADVIKKISETFKISADYLLFDEVNETYSARLLDTNLLNYFEKIQNLPQEEKDLIIGVIDAIIFKNEVKQISKPNHIKKK